MTGKPFSTFSVCAFVFLGLPKGAFHWALSSCSLPLTFSVLIQPGTVTVLEILGINPL